jgi:invasion protein IalB
MIAKLEQGGTEMSLSRHFPQVLAFCGAILLSPVASSAEDAPSLPGGASSLRETHGDWVVSCAIQAQGGRDLKLCSLSQEQTDSNSRQRVLALDQGAVLQVDDSPAGTPQKFRTCLPAGCLVPVAFDARILAALRKGTQLKVKAAADGGKETSFTISLKGFPNAFDRTAALVK